MTPQRWICAWAAMMCIAFVPFVFPQENVREVTDADLEAASAGRTVRLRIGANGSPAVVDLPLEVYVAQVLAAEGEPRAPAAAQEALAIAIRTFTAANAGRHRREGFDLCDSTHCQVLRASIPATRSAALATAARLLMYEGHPAMVFYSASCGGRSEAASQVWTGADNLPYLRSSIDDVHIGDEPWVVEMPIARVEAALHRIGFEGRRLTGLNVDRRTGSGRVMTLHLSGMRPNEISGEDFRSAIGARELRSTQFAVEKKGHVLRFTGRGYGHGVGLCVVGASRRAARGETASEILAQYYPGLTLEAPGGAIAAAPSPIELLVRRVTLEISTALGISSPPELRVDVHDSLDAFRIATGSPWWKPYAVSSRAIALAPPATLAQGEGVEPTVRRAVAEVLVAEVLADRPAWVRVGAARHYTNASEHPMPNRRVKCPSDGELTMAVSASAQRDAELRAEACFVRALTDAGNWRTVR